MKTAVIALYPPEPSAHLEEAIALSGVSVDLVGEEELEKVEALSPMSLLIIELGDQPLRRLRILRRIAEDSMIPILVVAVPDHIAALESERAITDFIVEPLSPSELRTRIGRLVGERGGGDVLAHRDLQLNTATYQASVAGSPVDLTYMEYELLRFFLENPGRVWSREQLLAKVWGYEYFGGARTVDVHVRRLRSKLGEERSAWITTIRSVGYRFG